VLSSSFGNPLAGRSAWTGNSGNFIATTVNLPPAALGHTVQLKWRCGSDSSVSASGWYVDSINLTAVTCCPVPTPPLLNAPAISNNQFEVGLLGTAGSNYVLQASTNLSGSNWVSLGTNPAPLIFIDTNQPLLPQRFYRAVIAP